MLLSQTRRGGRLGVIEMRSVFQKFLSYRWEELLQLNQRSKKSDRFPSDYQTKVALKLIRQGELSRAARMLTSNGLAPESEETVSKLKFKHPARRSDPHYQPPAAGDTGLILDQHTLMQAIRKAPRGSSAGPSGWRYEHLKCLIGINETADLLSSACNSIAQGHLPEETIQLLSSSRLIALPKKSNDVRPIAIGEVFRRITAKTICMQKREDFSAFFAPIQNGVAIKGGSELLIHQIQVILESHPDWLVLKTDVSNAFNCINRSHLLKEVHKAFPDLYNHSFCMYGRSSSLVYSMKSESIIIQSEEGVHQGDPLGPALFALGIHQILVDVQERNPNVIVLAYLDDVFILGLPKASLRAFTDLKSSLAQAGLVICDKKCEAHSAVAPKDWPDHLVFKPSGFEILGTPIGCDDYVSSTCKKIADSGHELCSKLVLLDDPQGSYLLWKHCHLTRLQHLARSVAPTLLLPAAQIHDALSYRTLCSILGFEIGIEDSGLQCSLPVRMGGLGLSHLQQLSPIAFLAAWAHSVPALSNRSATIGQMSSVLRDDSNRSNASIGGHLAAAYRQVEEMLPVDSKFQGLSLEQLLADPHKLQSRIASAVYENDCHILLNESSDDLSRARKRSVRGRGAGAWLQSIPTSDELAMNPCEFRIATCLRLGLPLPFEHWLSTCDCGAEIDPYGYHLLTCKKGGGPVWCHDSIVAGWSSCLRKLSIHHQKEPKNRYLDKSNRPDIVVFDTGSGCNVELDISLAHPWNKQVASNSCKSDGFAAKKREEEKCDKYAKVQLPSGNAPHIVPLVFEHFGTWGERAHDYLNDLSRRSVDEVGRSNAEEFKSYYRRCFSVLLQKCNARVIMKKLTLLTSDSASIFVDDVNTVVFALVILNTFSL